MSAGVDADVLRDRKLMIAISSFRDPADEDYCLARLSYFNGLERGFYWHSQQCIEKLLKCSLLLNGVRVSDFKGHDTVSMFERARSVFGSLMPDEIKPPPAFPVITDPQFGFGSTKEIVKKYASNGDPNIRYGLFYTDWNKVGLHSFDELIFTLRRLCGVLDHKKDDGTSLREILQADVRYQITFERTFKNDAISKMNFSFFSEEARKLGNFSRHFIPGFTNPPFYLLVQGNSCEDNMTIRWFLDNAFVPGEAKRELEEHLANNPIAP